MTTGREKTLESIRDAEFFWFGQSNRQRDALRADTPREPVRESDLLNTTPTQAMIDSVQRYIDACRRERTTQPGAYSNKGGKYAGMVLGFPVFVQEPGRTVDVAGLRKTIANSGRDSRTIMDVILGLARDNGEWLKKMRTEPQPWSPKELRDVDAALDAAFPAEYQQRPTPPVDERPKVEGWDAGAWHDAMREPYPARRQVYDEPEHIDDPEALRAWSTVFVDWRSDVVFLHQSSGRRFRIVSATPETCVRAGFRLKEEPPKKLPHEQPHEYVRDPKGWRGGCRVCPFDEYASVHTIFATHVDNPKGFARMKCRECRIFCNGTVAQKGEERVASFECSCGHSWKMLVFQFVMGAPRSKGLVNEDGKLP